MSKDLAKYYSIHNLINIKVNTKKRFFGNNVLNNPLSFFETNEEIDPDITINIILIRIICILRIKVGLLNGKLK